MPIDSAANSVLTKIYQRDASIVSRKVAGELFLVPVSGNLADMQNIFALNKVAEFVWERLNGKMSISDIRSEVLSHFEVQAVQADADLREFIIELVSAGLIHETGV